MGQTQMIAHNCGYVFVRDAETSSIDGGLGVNPRILWLSRALRESANAFEELNLQTGLAVEVGFCVSVPGTSEARKVRESHLIPKFTAMDEFSLVQ